MQKNMNILSFLDRFQVFRFSIWEFSFLSLQQTYGRDFIRQVIIRYPLRTIKGIILYQRAKSRNRKPHQFEFPESSDAISIGQDTVTGVGYCMKPTQPDCISGRGNHACWFFETNAYQKTAPLPECCSVCPIRQIGLHSLAAGCNFYIMTSALDILYDLFLPSLKNRIFKNGLFVLCRYSFEPFAIAGAIAGLQGLMIPFDSNDCADYETWLNADEGLKQEQTWLHKKRYSLISDLLKQSENQNPALQTYIKKGNIFFIQ